MNVTDPTRTHLHAESDELPCDAAVPASPSWRRSRLEGRGASLSRLKWLAVAAPVAFVAGLELIQQLLAPQILTGPAGYILLGGVLLLGAYAFASAMFGLIARLQDRLAIRNGELLALHEASMAVTAELELAKTLQTIIDRARELVGARYGELLMEQEAACGPTLVASGVAPGAGSRARQESAQPGGSTLSVPILSGGRVLGKLYLEEATGQRVFDAEDEETLHRFATHAALAIGNARLHARARELAVVEERSRIAREMHDGLAQVLGFVNIHAQAAQQLIERGKPEQAASELERLAGTARSAYADLRENTLGLRSGLDPQGGPVDALRAFLASWEEQSGIRARLSVPPEDLDGLRLPVSTELQLMRIVQEALSNVRKHSGGSEVHVELRDAHGWFRVTVEDDGEGFTSGSPGRGTSPRLGLVTMRERAEAVGGRLEVASSRGAGTRVTVLLPSGPATSMNAGE